MLAKFRDPAYRRQRAEYYVLGTYYDLHPNNGADLMEGEWDTLVLLDGCRYDTMSDVRPDYWPAVDPATSRAGNTYDFYRANFDAGPYLDTVVVTANPRTDQLRSGSFHRIINLWDSHWDDEHGTVMPDAMAKATIDAHESHSDKRIITHWMQPHYPFVGADDELADYPADRESIWHDLHRGVIDPERAYTAYRKTLADTLPHVEDVVDAVTGRVVVSSDHGNAFGERPWWYPFPVFGHPRKVRMPETVTVPWVVFDDGDRRTIEPAARSEGSDALESDDVVKSRLEDLGYREQ
jgi:hypothetical protein